MTRKTGLFGKPGRLGKPAAMAAFGCTILAGPAPAAELTYERLVNPEPQNWLMNHHDYTSQRFSALDAINASTPWGSRNLRDCGGGACAAEMRASSPGFLTRIDSIGLRKSKNRSCSIDF